MKIGIMGMGFVGTAMKSILESKHEVVGYDPIKDGYKDINVIKDVEVIFVCVGTPMQEDLDVDLKYIESAMKSIQELNQESFIYIKSTVPPGTCKKMSEKYYLNVGSNPEFLRERYAIRDMWASDRIILGGGGRQHEVLKEVYYPIFGDDVKYIRVTSSEGEMIKHATNSFLASQVGFANELYNVCKNLGIEYDNIKHALFLDNRLGRHIDVPGTDGQMGFGGHCLPKDLNALISHSKKNGYVPELFEDLWRFNVIQRK